MVLRLVTAKNSTLSDDRGARFKTRSVAISFSHILNGIEWARVHKVVVGVTNGSGNGRLRGIGTDRKRVRKESKV